jgi:hypothetical protein
MGATVLGAMAADLANFPAPFVSNGQFNAMIVVGDAAKTPDVIGAVDIATTLQYEMKQAAAASASGTATSTTVSGDHVQFQLSNKKLAIGNYLGDVINTLSKTDMQALASGTFANDNYDQLVTFPSGAGAKVEWLSEGGNNHRSEPGLYLHFKDGQQIFTYEADFPTEAKSSIVAATGDLTDFDSQSITMLGMKYDVVTATVTNSKDVKLTLMGGATDDVLNQFDSKTYTVNGKSYEVKAIYVGSDSAKFTVNGQTTNVLKAGDTYKLSDGTEIGVREVLAQTASVTNVPNMVEFYLGANKVVLEDTDITQANVGSRSLTVGSTSYTNDQVTISGSVSGSTLSLDSIKIALTSDNDYYLAPGEKLSQYIDGSGSSYLFGNADILYSGMTKPQTQDLMLNPVSTTRYELDVSTRKGVDYNIPVWNASSTTAGSMGGSDFKFYTTQNSIGAVPGTNSGGWKIVRKDEFLVTSGNAKSEDKDARIFSFDNFNMDSVTSGTLTIRDEAVGGGSKDLTLKNNTALGGAIASPDVWTGSTVIDGITHYFAYNKTAGKLWVNMSGTGNAEDGSFGLASGAYLKIVGSTTSSADILVGVPSTLVDQATADNKFNFTVHSQADGSGNAEVAVSNPADIAGAPAGLTSSVTVNTNYPTWYDTYGVKIVKDQSGNQDKMTVTVPYQQMLPQVFMTSGAVSTSTVQGASGSAYTIAPVKADIAMLDTEVGSTWKDNNVIVVGGPCVNTVAASLLGNPSTCTDGFTQGKARIQLFDQAGGKVAMLVAGYSADDTRRAASVVHNFRNYASSFKGTEVQVSGTSMSDITVTSVQ